MPKYRIIQFTTIDRSFVIEADDAAHAQERFDGESFEPDFTEEGLGLTDSDWEQAGMPSLIEVDTTEEAN
jgi:hypothetical protein